MKNVNLNSNIEYHNHICYTRKCNDTNLVYSSKDAESWKEITEEEYLKIQEIARILKRHADVEIKSVITKILINNNNKIK